MQARSFPRAPLLTIVLGSGDSDPRGRLLLAMAEALAEQGFAQTSVADVVRRARVSKRTFYEHFTSRDECYLATYSALSEAMLGLIKQAAQIDAPPEQRLAAACYTYLEALQSIPEVTRTFFTEIQMAGPLALKAQRRVHDRFADVMFELLEQGRSEHPGARPLSRMMAVAIVGAANELLMKRIDEGKPDKLRDLGDHVVELIRALMLIPPELARPA
ncbi:MAG TPA: TetR/AcrR family transcriptional regulator [Polyangiales bacterium]|nr:TetR/AcrR family transcriptional regulator [Polyangiales bacterium]